MISNMDMHVEKVGQLCKLSKELKKRDMLIPAEIILDSRIFRSMPSTCRVVSKPIYIQYMKGMSFDKAHFDGGNKWITILPLERYISIR